eukprot:4193524-Amphidinium_carterae.1
MAAERTVRELTNFGFAEAKVREALTHIGDPGDKEAAINWLLDQGEEDCGGTVELKHCHHVDDLGFQKLIKRADVQYGQPCKHGCNGTENWLCLLCAGTRCGRYAKKHSLAHFEETKREEEATITMAQAASGQEAIGHCLVLSLSDLSVWCYMCQSYVEHETLTPLVRHMEALKFCKTAGGDQDSISAASSSNMDVDVQVGTSMEAWHGRHGNPSWARPCIARACDEEARPGYRTKKAHEYLD